MSGDGNPSTSPIRVETRISAWQGPLPPPEAIAAYERFVPGAAKRLLDLAEEEARNRMAIERNEQESANIANLHEAENYHIRAKRGQMMACGLTFTALVIAAVCAYFHETAIGCAVIGASVLGIVRAIMTQRGE